MKRIMSTSVLGFLLLCGHSSEAATCTVGGFTYTCDVLCVGSGACNAPVSGCDVDSDGKCTACGNNSNNTIRGTTGNDVLCGFGGDDSLAGAPRAVFALGDDIFSGGDGNDRIYGGYGNDEMYGDAGDDLLQGGNGGSDTLVGGDGNDSLQASYNYSFTIPFGTKLCGGKGDDLVIGMGHGYQCVDGGADYDWCAYWAPQYPNDDEFGTARNCEELADSDPLEPAQPSCGCF